MKASLYPLQPPDFSCTSDCQKTKRTASSSTSSSIMARSFLHSAQGALHTNDKRKPNELTRERKRNSRKQNVEQKRNKLQDGLECEESPPDEVVAGENSPDAVSAPKTRTTDSTLEVWSSPLFKLPPELRNVICSHRREALGDRSGRGHPRSTHAADLQSDPLRSHGNLLQDQLHHRRSRALLPTPLRARKAAQGRGKGRNASSAEHTRRARLRRAEVVAPLLPQR